MWQVLLSEPWFSHWWDENVKRGSLRCSGFCQLGWALLTQHPQGECLPKQSWTPFMVSRCFFLSWALHSLKYIPINLISFLWHQRCLYPHPSENPAHFCLPLSSLLSSWKWLPQHTHQFLLFHHFETPFHIGLASLCPYHLQIWYQEWVPLGTLLQWKEAHLEPDFDVSMCNGSSVLTIRTSHRSLEQFKSWYLCYLREG